MKIAVIGASGRTGRVFVEQALSAGHTIRAGYHHKNKIVANNNLTVVNCDATNATDIANLLANQDAVVCLIGHVKGSRPRVQTDATKVLIDAMQQSDLKRIISLTGTGVRFSEDKITLLDRILNYTISLIDPNRVQDGREHVQLLKQSNLDWTVIRVLKLQNTLPKPFQLTLHGPTKWWVSRNEVARAILQVLDNGTFIKKAPIISKLSN